MPRTPTSTSKTKPQILPQPNDLDLKARGSVSVTAASIITTNRNVGYGEPEDNFMCIAELWDWLDRWVAVDKYSPQWIVAMRMVLMKVARTATGQIGHVDNYVDAIGYLDIANTLDIPDWKAKNDRKKAK